MKTLEALQPQPVWKHFQSLCAIPHPSRHETAIGEYVLTFARELGLDCDRDDTGNVVVRKPATAGYEASPGVILQAHLDMVPEKNSDTAHDFTKDPIQAYVDGDWVTARGTTLGADNGIGVAAALAVLESTDIEHGPLEALFTIDEESGMSGARALTSDQLQGRILLNLDTEAEGELYVGCAGGAWVHARSDYQPEAVADTMVWRKLSLNGLRGGHSGCDIHLGRGNAIRLMVRVLRQLEANGVRLSSFSGGSLANAIPREAEAVIAIPAHALPVCEALIDQFATVCHQELKAVEPTLTLTMSPLTTDLTTAGLVMPEAFQRQWLAALHSCPNGVRRMSDAVPGVVETSSNTGVLVIGDGVVHVQILPRSLLDSGCDEMIDTIQGLFGLINAEVWVDDRYPGWQPDPASPVLMRMQSAYHDLFGTGPAIRVIHAGLECGLFSTTFPDWDMVSFGPTIVSPHSPDEKVHIGSVIRFWELLQAGLKAIAQPR